jgi:ferrous iron transport protein A
MSQKKLSELRPGEAGVVERVQGSGRFRQRLLEMGLTRGVRVAMEKNAPLGDPTEYVVKGYHISLRKGEADLITLSLAGEDGVACPKP